MPARNCDLGLAEGQPDLVVTFTEAALDSALRASLPRTPATGATEACYLAHDPPGERSSYVPLPDLMSRGTTGENPFNIPDGTPYTDPRINLFNLLNFSVALRINLGLPPGLDPRALPQPVIKLDKGPDGYDGTFTMYCSQFTVVWNETPSPQNGNTGRWHVWGQPRGEAWGVPVRFKFAREIVTDAGGAVVQRVRVDLENAALPAATAAFGPLPFGSPPSEVVRKNFLSWYADLVRTAGGQALRVKTLVPTGRGGVGRDGVDGFMRITDFATRVSPYPAMSDTAVSHGHDQCRSLELLCAVNGRPLPPVPSVRQFYWTWAEPEDVPSAGGVIAVNRRVFIDWLKAQLLPLMRQACITPTVSLAANWTTDWPPQPGPFAPPPGQELVRWVWNFDAMGEPEITIHPFGPSQVFSARHDRWVRANCDAAHFQNFASLMIRALFMADVTATYTAIVVKRQYYTKVDWTWLWQSNSSPNSLRVFSRMVVDTYALTVDANGRLSLADPLTDVTDTSEPFGPQTFDVVTAPLLAMCTLLRTLYEGPSETPWFRRDEADRMRSFVFPGSESCTFREAKFSYGGDLICYTTLTDEDLRPKAGGGDDAGGGAAGGGGATGGGDNRDANGNGSTVPPNWNNYRMDDWNAAHPLPPGELPPASVGFSSELMTNYVQGTLHSAYGKFQALQTADGHSLVFSLTANNNFTVLEEASGVSHAGWTVHNLSTAAAVANFQGFRGVAPVRTFAVGQTVPDGTISMAMVLHVGGTDHLFFCLGNSNSDTSWIKNPQWTRCWFDAISPIANPVLTITGILFAEFDYSIGQQKILVDLERNEPTPVPEEKPPAADGSKPADDTTEDDDATTVPVLRADPDVVRYIVDPLAPGAMPHWTRHDLPVDIEAGSYQSCVGRRGLPPANVAGEWGDKLEGTYTCGVAGVSGQLVFVPHGNRFGISPPAPAVLHLPGGRVPDAIAAARNADDWRDPLYTTTDLYVASGDTLYRFAAGNQTHGSVGVPVKTAAVIQGTAQLTAMWWSGVVFLWGRNIRGEVYSLYCASSLLAQPAMWSNPLALATEADHMTSYVNRSDGGNTIFVASNGKLQKLTRAWSADGSWQMGWQVQTVVTNADPAAAKARPFNSYTTAVTVTGHDGRPAAEIIVGLSTKVRAPVYINGRYHVLSPRPTEVFTNTMGSITVVEATPNIASHTLRVYVPGMVDTAEIDPSAKSFKKLAGLNSEGALRGAAVPAQSALVAGGVTSDNPATTRLVDPSVSSGDLKAAAKNIGALNDAYRRTADGGPTQGLMMNLMAMGQGVGLGQGVPPPKTDARGRRLASLRVLSKRTDGGEVPAAAVGGSEPERGGDIHKPSALVTGGGTQELPEADPWTNPNTGGTDNNQPPPEEFWFDPEDLYHDAERWVSDGFTDGFDAFVDWGESGWHLVTKLGDRVYTFALTTAHEVVKAAVLVFQAIKSKIEDIIAYIMFLLQWNDISRTKKALHNTARLFLKHLAEDVVPSAGKDITDGIKLAEAKVREWAGTTPSGDGSSSGGGTFSTMDWSGLGAPAGLQASALAGNPNSGQSSASQLLMSHFQSHIGGLSLIGSSTPSVNITQESINILMGAVDAQALALEGAFGELQHLASDFGSLSLEDVLRRVAGVLAGGMLSSVGRVVEALVASLSTVGSSIVNMLDAQIRFPVISDILSALGIGSLSFLDLFCWIVAVAYTIAYKAAHGEAPFPDDGDTQKLIDAQTWADLAALKTPASPQPLAFPDTNHPGLFSTADAAVAKPRSDTDRRRYISGHGVSAIFSFIGNILQVFEANSPTGNNKWGGTSATVIGLVAAAANGYAGFFVPRMPLKEPAIVRLGQGTAAVGVIMKVYFNDRVQDMLEEAPSSSSSAGGGGATPGGGGATPGGGGTTPGGGSGGGAAPRPARDSRAAAAFVNAMMVPPALFCTAWHFGELVGAPKGGDRDAAILEETANLTRYISRIAYATAVNSEGQTKIAAVAVMAGANASAAGLEAAQAGIPL